MPPAASSFSAAGPSRPWIRTPCRNTTTGKSEVLRGGARTLRKALDLFAWRRRGRRHPCDVGYGPDGKLFLAVNEAQHAVRMSVAELRKRGGRCRNAVLLGDDGDAAIPQDIRILHVGHG